MERGLNNDAQGGPLRNLAHRKRRLKCGKPRRLSDTHNGLHGIMKNVQQKRRLQSNVKRMNLPDRHA